MLKIIRCHSPPLFCGDTRPPALRDLLIGKGQEGYKWRTNTDFYGDDNMYDFHKYLPTFIANGNPSDDTLRHYETEINNYIVWCNNNGIIPKYVNELEAKNYVRYLVEKEYSTASINLKIAAVKMFYFVALKLGVVSLNPFIDVKFNKPVYDDSDFDFLTVDELSNICNNLSKSNSVSSTRDLSIVLLMAVEGLRVVEVHRMSDEDIDFVKRRILIHGKNRDEYIYPCDDTMYFLNKYCNIRDDELNGSHQIPDDMGNPTFISLSKKFYGTRITRNGIRWSINNILSSIDRKTKGNSCHMLRHSCGTNLYSQTKDLRLVQETLRQKTPEMAARYAHIQERMNNRKTGYISPISKDGDNDET